MKTSHKGAELGARIEAEIRRAGRSRASVAKAIGMDSSHLTMVVTGERPISHDRLRKIASVLEIPLSTLTGDGTLQPGGSDSPADSPMSDPRARTVLSRTEPDAFIEAHHAELSPRDIEVLRSVTFTVGAEPSVAVGSDEFWWGIVEAARRIAAARRRGGDGPVA